MYSLLFHLTKYLLGCIPAVFAFFTILAALSQLLERSLFTKTNIRREPLLSAPWLLLVLEALHFCSGQNLMKEGILNMTQNELILEIASRMNNASRVFVLVAVITMVISVVCSVAGRANAQELRRVASTCTWFAFLFWFFAWIII